MTIDISSLGVPERINLLEKIFNAQKPASFFTSSGLRAPSFNRTEAEKLAMKSMTEAVFIDYLCGRYFKIEMSKNKISEYYDIDKSVKALM